MAAATANERDLIQVFRARITDLELDEEQQHEQHLLRWLRAREGDVGKAEEMLRRHIQWRKANGIGPSLFDWLPSTYIKETFQPKLCGFDSSGSPILLLSFGIWDIRPALARGEKENLIKFKDQAVEKVMRLMKLYENQRKYHGNRLSHLPAKITQFSCICEWTGYSMMYIMSKEVVEVMLEAARSFEANYPETLKAAYSVNCPKVFDILFKLVKPFLSERTLSKIFIYDSNEERWKAEILRNLPSDQVPVKYGGTKKTMWNLNDLNLDLNQDGTLFSRIFESGDDALSLQQGNINVQVGLGDTLTIPFIVDSSKAVLKWIFKVGQSESIDFSIQCESPDSFERQILCMNQQASSAEGELECEHAGNYWLVFDNSKSSSNLNSDDITVNYKLVIDIP